MNYFRIPLLTTAFVLAFGFAALAQWDDVYFDPAKDAPADNQRNQNRDRNGNFPGEELDYSYYDDEYQYYNDYDFYYTSRIRRFQRPYYGFGFYDPIYVDAFYYDPFFRPGLSVLIYDDFHTNRNWLRYRPWAAAYNASFFQFPNNGVNSRFWFSLGLGYPAFSPLNNPWYGYNAFFCPPSWGGNNIYNNVSTAYADGRAAQFGPRRTGTVRQPRLNVPVDRTIGTPRTTGVNSLDNQRVTPGNGRTRFTPSSRNANTNNTLRTRERNAGRRAISTAPRTRNNSVNSSRRSSGSRSSINNSRSSRSSGSRISSPRRSSSPSRINRSSGSRSSSGVRSSTRSSSSRSSSTRRSSSGSRSKKN